MSLKTLLNGLIFVVLCHAGGLAYANNLEAKLSTPSPAVKPPIQAGFPELDPLEQPTQPYVGRPMRISIVIDDLGDNSIIARQLLSLTWHMTAAILPHTPHARDIAKFATLHGHEVIMHLPMEAFTRPDLLGPGALYANMGKADLQQTLLTSAASVPNMVGFNNHMGSLLTEDAGKMAWVMESAKQNGWYFLDSKTSDGSVAETVAEHNGIPTIGRDIFLDHHDESQIQQLPLMISRQFEKAKKIARHRGWVVIICHPYPQTLQFLRQQLPLLDHQYQLVSLSQLLPESEAISHLAQYSK